MRLLAWAGLALVLLVVGALLAADAILTGMVNRDPLRSEIDRMVDEALGRDASWESLGIALFPPSLVVNAAVIAAPDAGAEPFVEAVRAELRVRPSPLVVGQILMDSIFVEQATVRLELTEDGLALPDFGGEESETGRAAPDEDTAPARVAIRMIELEDARLIFSDRTISTPRGIELVDVAMRLQGESFDDPFSVEVELGTSGGGLAEIRGTAGLSGELDLVAELEDFPLLPLDPYLEAADEVDGRVTGTITIQGPAAAPSRVKAALEVADARLRFQDTLVEGPLTWELEHAGPWGTPRGTFRIDATRARASLAGIYEKAPGRPATITGRLISREGVLGFDDVELRIENAEARGTMELDDRLHSRLKLAPVELGHWQPLLKPLRDFQLSGRIESKGLEIWNQPLELKGRLRLERVRVAGPAGRSVTVDGAVVASDGTIRSEDFVLESAGQAVPMEIEITDLAGAWRCRARGAGKQLDSNELVSALGGQPDTVFGVLDFDGDVTSALAGQTGFLRSLGGTTRFRIAPGRLKGISILEATFRRFDEIGRSGPLGGLLLPRGGLAPRMKRFYRDDFQLLSANLALSEGVAQTEDLRLKAEGYEFTMVGRIDLVDLGLDARGEILLGQDLMQAMVASVGLKRLPVQPIVIPIPRLRGTATNPKPEPDFRFLLRALTGNLPGAGLLKGPRKSGRKP